MNAPVLDVTESSFSQEVLDQSKERPVVVDFWAPWCGPCRTLGPVLEELAHLANGAWSLAKVNSDEAPQLVREYGIQGIPAVKVFAEGHVAGEFVGALPRLEVESFLRTVVAVAGDAIHLRRVRESLGSGDLASARARLDSISLDSAYAEDAAMIRHLLRRAGEIARDGKAVAARAGAAQEATGAARHFDRAAVLASGGDFPAAIGELLEVVRLDRSFEDDAGRRALLALFTLLGKESETAREARGKLGALLF